ncbi:MAG: aminoacyl-tRNA hydrolase [Clostridia bacterium]|nr:aminoacyl-tRNA hydrolase [Clostridia bacterium]
MNIDELFKKIAAEREAKAACPITFIVAGLGNPGKEYDGTRHNAGFAALDYISEKCGEKVQKAKFDSLVGEANIAGARVLLMKPQTFMNSSGTAISVAADFYKIAPENVIVLCDDIAQDPGKMRIRKSGSAGGHNGLKSIIAFLDSVNFKRIRIGVGAKPNPEYDLADWVLGKFSADDKKLVESCFEKAYNAIELIVKGDIEKAMCAYN